VLGTEIVDEPRCTADSRHAHEVAQAHLIADAAHVPRHRLQWKCAQRQTIHDDVNAPPEQFVDEERPVAGVQAYFTGVDGLDVITLEPPTETLPNQVRDERRVEGIG
jgi:hypothetical protein